MEAQPPQLNGYYGTKSQLGIMRRGEMGRGFSFSGVWHGDGEDSGGFDEEINSKLLSMCAVWVRTGRFSSRGLRGQHQLHSGLCPPRFTETGVGLQLGLGNTHLKTGTHLFSPL